MLTVDQIGKAVKEKLKLKQLECESKKEKADHLWTNLKHVLLKNTYNQMHNSKAIVTRKPTSSKVCGEEVLVDNELHSEPETNDQPLNHPKAVTKAPTPVPKQGGFSLPTYNSKPEIDV